jgi:hypothetical protein
MKTNHSEKTEEKVIGSIKQRFILFVTVCLCYFQLRCMDMFCLCVGVATPTVICSARSTETLSGMSICVHSHLIKRTIHSFIGIALCSDSFYFLSRKKSHGSIIVVKSLFFLLVLILEMFFNNGYFYSSTTISHDNKN